MATGSWWQRLGNLIGPPASRTTGRPPSGNGASSFHLIWDAPPTFAEAAVTFEVTTAPSVARLYFWAMQVSFVDPTNQRATVGGAHLGLQFHPDYPNNGAVCWGGYRHGSAGSGELDGSALGAPSARRNVNVCNYQWQPDVAYRYRVFSPSPGHWRGTITELSTGAEFVIRDLYSPATALTKPMCWTEAFADCDHASVDVRWSNPEVIDHDGTTVPITTASTNYQAVSDGGCTNTNSVRQGGGWVQRTNVERQIQGGQRLTIG